MTKRNKFTKSFINCELEVAEGGGGYRISVFSDDGYPLSAQQIMDAVSDAVLMEFGLDFMSEDNDNLPN